MDELSLKEHRDIQTGRNTEKQGTYLIEDIL